MAFVNYLHKDDAQRAMRLLDRSTLPGGRQLHITLQAPRKVRRGSVFPPACRSSRPAASMQAVHRGAVCGSLRSALSLLFFFFSLQRPGHWDVQALSLARSPPHVAKIAAPHLQVRAAAAASKAAVATMQRHQQLQQQQQPMAMLMGVQPTAALPLQHQQQQQHLLSWEQQQQQQLRNMMMGVQTVAVAAPQPQPQPQAGPSASAWILSQQGGGDVVGAGMPPTGYW